MKRPTLLPKEIRPQQGLRSHYRRILAIILLAASVFVAPAIASVNRALLNKVCLPRIDSRAIEFVQRWIEEKESSRPEEA